MPRITRDNRRGRLENYREGLRRLPTAVREVLKCVSDVETIPMDYIRRHLSRAASSVPVARYG